MEKGDVIKWREPYGPSVRRRWAQFKDWLALLPRQMPRIVLIGVLIVVPVAGIYLRDLYHIWPEAPSPWPTVDRDEPFDWIEFTIVMLIPLSLLLCFALTSMLWPVRVVLSESAVFVDSKKWNARAIGELRLESDDLGVRWLVFKTATSSRQLSPRRVAIAPSVDADSLAARIAELQHKITGRRLTSIREPFFAPFPRRLRSNIALLCFFPTLVIGLALLPILHFGSDFDPLDCLTCSVFWFGLNLFFFVVFIWFAVRPRTAHIYERAIWISEIQGEIGYIDRGTIEVDSNVLAVELCNKRGRTKRSRFILPNDAPMDEIQSALRAVNARSESP